MNKIVLSIIKRQKTITSLTVLLFLSILKNRIKLLLAPFVGQFMKDSNDLESSRRLVFANTRNVNTIQQNKRHCWTELWNLVLNTECNGGRSSR